MARISPVQQNKLLEIKVMWGGIVLDVRHFTGDQAVTVGTHPDATFKMITALPGEQTFTLVSPGGAGGHVVNAERSMEMEIRRNGSVLDSHQLPATGTVRAHALGIKDRCRVLIGQLAFVIQYITPATGVKSRALATADLSLAKWVVVFLVVALGLWTAIQLTPPPQADFTSYITNPSRFAGMITPNPATADKKKFADIESKKIIEVEADDKNWKKYKRNPKNKKIGKKEDDRDIARKSGIPGLLKNWMDHTGRKSTDERHAFMGAPLTELDQHLEKIPGPAVEDSGGMGGLRNIGGRPDIGGDGLTSSADDYSHRFMELGHDSIDIARTTKKPIKVDRDPTATKLYGDGLSMELVGEYMTRRWNNFKFCYSKELDRDPNLWGKVTVTFTIGANGRVSEAVVLQTSLSNANVEECVLRGIRRIRFPRPHGGGEVIVTYPFLFTTTQ